MLGDTLTMTVGATPVTVDKINQDGYSGEYLKKRTTDEIRVRVRHSKERISGGQQFERHNVELTQTIYPTVESPLGKTRQAYIVIRVLPNDSLTDCVDLAQALVGFLTEPNLDKIVGWHS